MSTTATTNPEPAPPTVGPEGAVALAPRFPVLDTLRAVGALAVLTTHTTFQSGDYTDNGVWGSLLARLDVGVAVFFVLSGFLLSRPHLARAVTASPAPATGRYYWKRFVRIYPIYVVSVVIALGLLGENAGTSAGGWITTLLMMDVYVDESLPHGLTQMWSLAAEVAFYALLPFLMWLALGRSRQLRTSRVGLVLLGLVAVSVGWHLAIVHALEGAVPGVPGNWLPAHLTWFAVGIWLALAHVRAQSTARPSRSVRLIAELGALPGTCWALAGGLLLLAATPLAGPTLLFLPTASESLTKHLLYALIGGLLVLTGVFPAADSRYARVLSTPVLRRLGHISYSIFCIHLCLLYLAWHLTGYPLFGGHGLQIWAITLVLSVVASELLYRFVEEPSTRLKNV